MNNYCIFSLLTWKSRCSGDKILLKSLKYVIQISMLYLHSTCYTLNLSALSYYQIPWNSPIQLGHTYFVCYNLYLLLYLLHNNVNHHVQINFFKTFYSFDLIMKELYCTGNDDFLTQFTINHLYTRPLYCLVLKLISRHIMIMTTEEMNVKSFVHDHMNYDLIHCEW